MPFTSRLSDWYTNLGRKGKWVVKLLLLLIVLMVIVYHFFLPLKSISMDLPIAKSSPIAIEASHELWDMLHADDATNLDAVIQKFTQAYELDQNDEVLNSLIGGAHIWRFSLRNRLGVKAESLREDLDRGLYYSEQNMKLFPENRTSTAPSMAATVNWQLGVLDNDAELITNTHFRILANSQVWPEFAAFMQGWILAAMLDPEDPFYKTDHLGYQFMLDQCAGFQLPKDIKFTKFLHSMYSLKSLTKPECYNNTIAPHSIEGTLLSVGDAWLKENNIERATLWYNNAKTSPTFDDWKYKPALQDRIDRPEYYRDKFLADNGKLDVEEPAMSYQSVISCGLCHTK